MFRGIIKININILSIVFYKQVTNSNLFVLSHCQTNTMYLRLLFAIFFVLLFSSCDFISPKKYSHQTQAVLDTIVDYSTVDVYPLLRECNNCDTNKKQNLCFENELIKKLEKILNKSNFKAANSFKDTVHVDLLVDNNGKVTIVGFQSTDKVSKEIPLFDSIIEQSIQQLPNLIQPSIKRGIPVRSQFKLPIVVNVKY